MNMGDCPKCGKRTMVVLGVQTTEAFKVTGLCYNCKLTFEDKANIEVA
jgi:transcription elongation factor Elf1